MIHPPFVPKVPPNWVYTITSVRSIGHGGHLVIYLVESPSGYQEQRTAFVNEEGHTKWDMITWCDQREPHYKERRAQKMDRIVLRVKRVRMVRR